MRKEAILCLPEQDLLWLDLLLVKELVAFYQVEGGEVPHFD